VTPKAGQTTVRTRRGAVQPDHVGHLGVGLFDRLLHQSLGAAHAQPLLLDPRAKRDLLTLIAGARWEDGRPIAETDAQSVLMQLLVGGNETTTSLMTNLVWRLLEVPERWAALVRDPSLVEAAIEESLRFDPPVLGLYRNTTRDVVVDGVTIPANSKVYINYAAANRDASVFRDPDTFDLHRPARRHMSFGLGVHFCLGAPTARMEAEIALHALLRRMPGLRLLGSGERIAPFFLWGRRRLPVAWR